MTILSKAQLERDWIEAGGRPAAANMAASIALAESSGNTDAESDYDDDGSYAEGVMQVEEPLHANVTPGSPFNPIDDMEAAVEISGNGTDWSAWTTYTSGAYLKYLGLPGGSISSNTAGTSSGGATTSTSPSSSSTTSTSGSSGDLGKGFSGFLLKALLTVSFVIGGLALAGVGARNALSSVKPQDGSS